MTVTLSLSCHGRSSGAKMVRGFSERQWQQWAQSLESSEDEKQRCLGGLISADLARSKTKPRDDDIPLEEQNK